MTHPSLHNDRPTSSQSRRLLVIDRADDIRQTICAQLRTFGFDVVAENDGMAGLSRLAGEWETDPFHGMLVELYVPVLGGLAVLQEMGERFPTVPVIAMSDVTHVAKLRQAVNLGAKEYLIKPFDAELFRRKCHSVFLGE
jgi:DNA-binding response OmpR family regulator